MGRIISTEDFKHLARKVSLEGTLYSIVMTVYTFIALRIIAVMTVTLDLKLQTISIVWCKCQVTWRFSNSSQY